MTYFKPGQDIPLYGNFSTQFNYLDNPIVPKMSFIDLPAMNIQVHCHEGENGTAHFKERCVPNPKSIPMLTSYEFAMGDLYAKMLGLKTIKK